MNTPGIIEPTSTLQEEILTIPFSYNSFAASFSCATFDFIFNYV